jgi:tetratricopeptide (TPR) repeat protein
MYDNLMNKFKFGNLNSTQAHTDSDYRRMIYNFRGNFARLADELTKRGDKERALAILDQAEKMMPDHCAPHNIYSYTMIDAYYKAGAYDKGNKIIDIVANRANQDLLYIKSLNPNQRSAFDDDENMDGYFIESFVQKCRQAGQEDMAKKLEAMLPK